MVRGDPMAPSTSRVAMPDHTIGWYRTKIPADVKSEVHKTSDLKGFAQTLSFLGTLGASFGLCLHCHATGRLGAALIFGLLMPGETDARATPIELPSMHVVVLGGGQGLTRAVALECVRRGADVTVLAAGALLTVHIAHVYMCTWAGHRCAGRCLHGTSLPLLSLPLSPCPSLSRLAAWQNRRR